MRSITYKGGGGVLILAIFVHTYYVDDPTLGVKDVQNWH